jgi:hypothetical protein
LFSLLLRCIEHYSQVGSMTVAELRRENCVFFCACLCMYQFTACMLYTKVPNLAHKSIYSFLDHFFFLNALELPHAHNMLLQHLGSLQLMVHVVG